MAKHIRCKICNTKVPIENAILKPNTKGVYFCSQTCMDTEASQSAIKSDWQLLMDKLQEIYGDECNYPQMCQQIKYLQREYGFKEQGMLLTLNYYTQTLGLEVNLEYGVQGVLTTYYEKAKRHYIQTHEIAEAITEFEFDPEPEIIHKTRRTHPAHSLVEF